MKNITPDQEWLIFLDKIQDYADSPHNKWTILTLLAYFLQKYKSVNGIDFVFSFNKKGPTQTKEMKNASQIWNMFDRGRYKQLTIKEEKQEYKIQLVNILKDYINWSFDIKFYGRTTNITGLGLLTTANFMNEFLQWRKNKKNNLPKRKSQLSKEFLLWIESNVPDIINKHQIKTLEDLNGLINYINVYSLGNESHEYIVIEKARELNILPPSGKIKLDKK